MSKLESPNLGTLQYKLLDLNKNEKWNTQEDRRLSNYGTRRGITQNTARWLLGGS